MSSTSARLRTALWVILAAVAVFGGCAALVAVSSSVVSTPPTSTRSPTTATPTFGAGIPRISPIPIPVPPGMTTAPAASACDETPARIVEMIDAAFTNGQHLEDVQALDGPRASIYVGGNIVNAAGERESSHNAWLYANGQIYALTKDARRDTLFTDGRDLAPADFFSDDFATLSDCITNLTRARNGAPPLPPR